MLAMPSNHAGYKQETKMTTVPVPKPVFVTEAHLLFLDKVRVSGVTNMYAASPYVARAFPKLSTRQAKDVLIYWMKTFSERHPS
jgi:hypothetical protein